MRHPRDPLLVSAKPLPIGLRTPIRRLQPSLEVPSASALENGRNGSLMPQLLIGRSVAVLGHTNDVEPSRWEIPAAFSEIYIAAPEDGHTPPTTLLEGSWLY